MTCNNSKRPACRRPFSLLVWALLIWLLAFAVGKAAFMLVCHGQEPAMLADFVQVWWHGLPMDLSTAAYLLLVPWLCLFAAQFVPWRGFKLLLIVYHCIASLLVVSCIVADLSLYPFWGFKLDATIFNYIDSPADALASVSLPFVLVRVAAALIGAAVLSLLFAWVVRRCVCLCQPVGRLRRCLHALAFVLAGGLLFVVLRGGVTESTMNVGHGYYTSRQFLNHATVNPAFSLLSSSMKTERFGQLYNLLPEAEMERVLEMAPYNPPVGDEATPPAGVPRGAHIILIVWEGCGGQLTEPIGGRTDVTPHFNALVREGLFFSQLRANSFRTDRGLLSILSGHVSYPTHSLMKMATKAARLPSIAHVLHTAGYTNTFVYGGDINFTNMRGYLLATGYDRIIADAQFTRAEQSTSKWGANDSILFDRLWHEVEQAHSPQFITALTLSSHEPWDVPSRRLADPKLNAFAYTDAQLGRFMSRLKESDLWPNTLVIVLPDHGVLAGSVGSWQDPRFFHIPMVWTGGALSSLAIAAQPAPEPAAAALPAAREFGLPCAQSDLAATLLGALGLPHRQFIWSRDVFSPSYARYPFTYSTFVDGFAYTDSTGTTIFDNISGRTVVSTNAEGEAARLLRGQAIQQKSYDLLEEL